MIRPRILKFGSAAALLAATVCAAFAIRRASLPYNSQGRFFDETQGIVLDEQVVIVAAVLAGLLYAFAIAGFILARRK